MSAEHRSIERCGDTELWVVDGANWDLPVLADPYGTDGKPTHYRLRPPADAAITIDMLKAMDARVNPFRVPSSGSHVIVEYENLQRFAKKAPGITPGYYIKWREGAEPERDLEPEQLIPDPPDTDEGRDFCVYLQRLTGVVDFPTLRLIWKAIVQHGPKWLIEERKPIDFGFAKLVPIPYRANWKGILSARFPFSATAFWKSKPERNRWVEERGFGAEMYNTVLAAFDTRGGACLWTLEAVTGKRWHECTTRHERYKAGTLGPARYADFWRRGIKKMFPHLIEAFAQWVDWNHMPCAQPHKGPIFGCQRLIPWVPLGRVMPAAPSAGPQLVVVNPDITELKGPPETKRIRGAPKDMLELPDILPEPRYVRLLAGPKGKPKGPAVAEPTDAGAGTNGLPVLHAGEGEDPQINVLAEGPGVGDGLAGQS